LRAATDEMVAAYRNRDWAKARSAIAESRDLVGDFRISGLYDLYESRIGEYEKNPPAADWDGVFIATTK